MITDPIADMLTRIRNGGRARLVRVSMPRSRLKVEVARVLKESGFIANYSAEGAGAAGKITIEIRYGGDAQPIVEGIQRVSRPGRRVYVDARKIPRIRNGLGIAILSTPHGVITGEQAREAGIGGEILAKVW